MGVNQDFQDSLFNTMTFSANMGMLPVTTLYNLSGAIQGVFGATYAFRGMITCTTGTNPNESFDNCFIIDMHFYTDSDGNVFPGESISTMVTSLGDLMQTNGYGGAYVEVNTSAGTARVYFNSTPYGGYFNIKDITPNTSTLTNNPNAVTPGITPGNAQTGAPTTQYPPTNVVAATTTPVTLDSPASGEALKTVNMSTSDGNEFFRDCLLLLEGVSVPYNTITVSYGINTPPTCTLIIPAHEVIRELPEDTKVHIFFKDILQDSDGQYKWRLLFDGETSSWSYSKDAKGAYITINCIHSCAYTTMMQIMTLDAAQYLFNTSTWIGGDSTIPIMFSQNRMHSTIIASILSHKYSSMVDIVYQMFRGILASNQDTGTGKFYGSKLGMVEGGWKMPGRFYGVSASTAALEPPNVSWTNQVANEGNTHKTTGSTSGSTSGSGNNTSNVPAVSGSTPCVPVGDSNAYYQDSAEVMQGGHFAGSSQQYIIPCNGTLTSPYGPRTLNGNAEFHPGVDIANDVGTAIVAAGAGVCHTEAESESGGYGNLVVIDHGNGIQTWYGHMTQFLVSEGQTVNQGDQIGLMGSTGYSTGPHCHFGMLINGSWDNPIKYT